MSIKRRASNRQGVTAVEFAMVAPIVFLLVFFIFELARLMMFGGNVNTALLTGARKATLADATASEIDEVIRTELKKFGINEAQISLNPPVLLPNDPSVQIDMEVPISATNGIILSQITMSKSVLSRSITIDRE